MNTCLNGATHGPIHVLVGGQWDVSMGDEDEALIGIRSKTATLPALTATTPSEQLGWKAFNLLVGPLALLAFGAMLGLAVRRRD
jgi:hypothetical protein